MQRAAVDPEVLGARLRQQQQIDDPVMGATEALEVEAGSVLWPHTRQWARIEPTSLSENGARRLEEYRLTPAISSADLPAFGGPGLPVAILFERTPNGASRARMYSVEGLAPARAQVLSVDTHLLSARDGADVLSRYFAALQTADLPATLACFDAQATLQDFDGTLHSGHAQLRAVYVRRYAHGGIHLRYCSRLDDGPRSALELLDGDGRPALAVFERAPGGTLTSARWYR
jgi:hypothetical protein